MKILRKYNHTEAFRYFDVEPRNVRNSWSAKSVARKIVVVTVWDHELGMVRGRYSVEGTLNLKKNGGREMLENLLWAIDHCGGRVHVVRAFARDCNAKELKIDYCVPASFTMLVSHVNPKTGRYLLQIELAEQIAA
jgi:hypothetical protein